MGSVFSSSGRGTPPTSPPEFIQLSESVWQLYPDFRVSTPSDIEVVLLHGLQPSDDESAYWKTWRCSDGATIWPQAWRGPAIRRDSIRILSISYASSARERHGRGYQMDPYVVVQNLVSDLLDAGVGQNCPLVLVGHSLGGIMIKHVILELLDQKSRHRGPGADELVERFLKNCKGVFYYSSPHGGSAIADWIIWGSTLTICLQLRWVIATLGLTERLGLNYPIVTLLRRLSTKTAVLNREFDMAKHNLGDGLFRTRAICETLPKTIMGGNIRLFRVVQLASAMLGVDGEIYTAPRVNHSTVCKPENNTTDPSFKYLLSFINALLDRNAVRPAELPEISQLNESVWELWAPANSSVPEVEVVFFHGLHEKPVNHEEAFWKPWLSRDGTSIWPEAWLSTALSNPRILSISYVSIAESHQGWTEPYIVAENLIQDMIDAQVGQNCPVVLVGHSLGGGIIIRKIIVQYVRKKWLLNRTRYHVEVNRLQNFMENCRSVTFYSTPHYGFELAEYAESLTRREVMKLWNEKPDP